MFWVDKLFCVRMANMFLDPDVTEYIHLKAIVGDHFTVRKLLRDCPEKVHSRNGRLTVPPLYYACRYGHLNVCQVLYEYNAVLDDNIQGWTPLHEACAGNRVAIVDFLLSKGVNPNVSLRFSRLTPLMQSARHNFLECCRILVEGGADVWARDVDGNQAVDLASKYPCKDFLEGEMKREWLWKAWALSEALPPRIECHCPIIRRVITTFPQELYVELVQYV